MDYFNLVNRLSRGLIRLSSVSVLFGAIADDFTGGADLAGMLFEQGVRTALLFGNGELPAEHYDAAVICLKTRSVAAAEARQASLDAFQGLHAAGARQIQFKYCSTFDSTPAGNIGAVCDALMEALNTEFTIAVPALPVNGRTQYMGHLFVNGVLLSDSPMRHHPLNPMTDSNLVRWLQLQTTRRVGLINLEKVRSGSVHGPSESEIALVDAISDKDLTLIANAFADLPLITGGSGLAMKLPQVWRDRRWLTSVLEPRRGRPHSSQTLILSGSCSAATLAQLDAWQQHGHAIISMRTGELTVSELDRLTSAAEAALDVTGVALISSSAEPGARSAGASSSIEHAFAVLAQRLVPKVGRLIVAGGETAGAVVEALDIRAVELTGILDPGVPAMRSLDDRNLALALKSGNFGGRDFFRKAMEQC